MAKTTEEIARDAVDQYLQGKAFNTHIELMLEQARSELVTKSEKKARNWALGTAGLIIGIFAILVGLQFIDIRLKYAEIRNTHADIRNEFDGIVHTQREIRNKADEAEKLVNQIKKKLSNDLEPAVFSAEAKSKQLMENYNTLNRDIQNAVQRTEALNKVLTDYELRAPMLHQGGKR